MTFRALCDAFTENHLPSLAPGTQVNYRGHIAVMMETLGDLAVEAVSKAALGDLQAS